MLSRLLATMGACMIAIGAYCIMAIALTVELEIPAAMFSVALGLGALIAAIIADERGM